MVNAKFTPLKTSFAVLLRMLLVYTTFNLSHTLHFNANAIEGTVGAQVMQQIASTSAGNMEFGKVVPTATIGTVTISPTGDVTNAGGARYIPNSGAHIATLTFSGQPNQNINIETPTSTTIANGENTMTVNFLYPTLPTTIGAAGTATMNYGGTLNVGANQAAGVYTGTYDIYVTYA